MTIPENFDGKNEHDLLIGSYNSIENKNYLEIITSDIEKKALAETFLNTFQIDLFNSDFSIQNLFKLTKSNGHFYIAQCLFDFGLSFGGGKYDRFLKHRYHYDLFGFGVAKVELGETLLREKTIGDKLVGHFLHSSIQIKDCDSFNEKFYLVSDKKENIIKFFDKDFANTVNKYNGLCIRTKANKIYLTFENHLEQMQSRIVEDIFSAFKYWVD